MELVLDRVLYKPLVPFIVKSFSIFYNNFFPNCCLLFILLRFIEQGFKYASLLFFYMLDIVIKSFGLRACEKCVVVKLLNKQRIELLK